MNCTCTVSRGAMVGAIAGLAAHAGVARAQYSVQRLIATGDSATGAPAAMTDAAAPLIDRFGQSATTLNLTGGATRHVVRGVTHYATMLKAGQVAPGYANGVVGQVGGLRTLSSDGEMAVVFEAHAAGSDIDLWYVSVGDPFDWSVGYREGTNIPDRSGLPRPWFEVLPQISFLAPDRNLGFWHEGTWGQGVYQLHAVAGDEIADRVLASGDDVGFGWSVGEVRGLGMDATGDVLLAYSLNLSGQGTPRRHLAFGARPWDIFNAVSSYDTAPEGGTFDEASPVRGSCNAMRHVVFVWKTDVVNANLDKGVWTWTPGQGIGAVMREGFGVPGHPGLAFGEPHDYANVSNMMRSPVIGGGGHIAFVSRLRGNGVTASNDSALFFKSPGQPVQMIAREGDESGIDDPAYGDFLDADVNFWVNVRGDLLFKTNRVDNGEVLCHRSADGVYFHNIAATGRLLPGAGGVQRVINRVANPDRCSGGEDGRGSILNDAGQVAFAVSFTDGTQAVYRATVPTPPPECPADFDGDGFITGLDFDAFVAAFEAGEAEADFDRDGFIAGPDFDAFVEAFEAGC